MRARAGRAMRGRVARRTTGRVVPHTMGQGERAIPVQAGLRMTAQVVLAIPVRVVLLTTARAVPRIAVRVVLRMTAPAELVMPVLEARVTPGPEATGISARVFVAKAAKLLGPKIGQGVGIRACLERARAVCRYT